MSTPVIIGKAAFLVSGWLITLAGGCGVGEDHPSKALVATCVVFGLTLLMTAVML